MPATILDPILSELHGKDPKDQHAAAINPKRLAAMLQMTQLELASLANVHRTTIARNPESPEVQAKLGPIATILSRAADMSGALGKAVVWFRHQPIAAFGFKRAADLVQEGRASAVLEWLDALEDGAAYG
jgi:uncharacterized protein (DUF2384 family)